MKAFFSRFRQNLFPAGLKSPVRLIFGQTFIIVLQKKKKTARRNSMPEAFFLFAGHTALFLSQIRRVLPALAKFLHPGLAATFPLCWRVHVFPKTLFCPSAAFPIACPSFLHPASDQKRQAPYSTCLLSLVFSYVSAAYELHLLYPATP